MRKLLLPLASLIILAMLLSACGAPSTSEEPAVIERSDGSRVW